MSDVFRRLPRTHRDRSRGQSVVEFSLILPILLILGLAIADFSRIYTAQLAIESAAREAADYGAFRPDQWAPAARGKTESDMKTRACVAASRLTNYRGPDDDCENPKVVISLTDKSLGSESADCAQADRDPPCWVRVDVTYQFDLIAPIGIDFAGGRLGLPSSLTFTRTSIFAISNFELDRP